MAGTTTVIVTQIDCQDPNCVPIETVIALLGPKSRWVGKILKPMSQIQKSDVISLLLSPEIINIYTKDNIVSEPAEAIPELLYQMTLKLESIDNLSDRLIIIENIQNSILLLKRKTELLIPNPTLNPSLDHTHRKDSSLESNFEKMSITNVSMVPKSEVKVDLIQNMKESENITKQRMLPSPTSQQFQNNSNHLNRNNSIPISVDIKPDSSINVSSNNNIFQSSNTSRHNKGVRQRGCPCCDPDNVDNIVDKLLFFENPP
jgi:hypothetical protein